MKFKNAGYNWHYCAPYYISHDKDEDENIIYFFHTPAVLTVSGREYSVDYGNIVIIKKGEPHSVTSSTGFYMLDWVSFSLDKNDINVLNSLFLPFNEIMDLRYPDTMSNMVMNMCLIMKIENTNNDATLVQLLTAAFFCISSLRQDSEDLSRLKIAHPEILKLRRKIFEEPQLDWTIESMCRETLISASMLQKLYRMFFDVSCKEDVIASRISHAKHLLISTNDSIAEVAEKCGFNSYSHFSRTFKKQMLRSPLEFRHEYDIYPR
ncbi:MAG: helix-turn-helix transcriptional regulator [Ruminococcus sp.]|nr:helix-turn-helix transcriptional regulator [Ruminococcus sp.]